MNRAIACLAALGLLCAIAFAADEKPWPQKGDKIYVSVPLRITQLNPITFNRREWRLDACEAVTVTRSAGDDAPIYFRTNGAESSCFKGDWSSRMHRTKEACAETVKSGSPVRADAKHGLCFYLEADGEHGSS